MATRTTTRTGTRAAVETASQEPTVTLQAGPGKQRSDQAPPPRLSLHKARAMWFRARVSWPLREAPIERLRRGRRAAQRLPRLQGQRWTLAGPANIGGRCTSIVCDPAQPDHLWLGSAGGGVWTSRDAGATWRAQWPARAPLQIGSLAVDPSRTGTLYAGTGEANLSADSYPGDGVYRTSDGGKRWRLWASSLRHGMPRRIGTVAVDPFDSNHVCVGGVGYGRMSSDGDVGGLYVTRDGGRHWTRETFVTADNYWCHHVVFDPVHRDIVFATFTVPGAASGIYRSRDGGRSWQQLTKGLPDSARIGRTSLAMAPSNPRVIYALGADAGSANADGVLGVFRSNDGGDRWRSITGSHFAKEGQMSYGNTIAVHPSEPDTVLCGGVDLHLSVDGGASWRRVTRWDATRGDATYAHADHHQLLMPTAKPGRVLTANDGGVDISEDGGRHWANRSAGLSVTMYYDIDVAQTDARLFGGGAQDNGTLVTTTGRVDDAREILGGDGGWMVIDPREAGHLYASFQFGGMYRFRNGRQRDVSPPFKDSESGGIWMVYITFDPNDSEIVYTGNQRLYRTRNDGLSWDALSPVLDGSPLSAIEVAPGASNVLYVGTENGGFFSSSDGGATWSPNLASSTLPGVMITRIACNPRDETDVVVTVANFGNRHVFRSLDGGRAWSDIDGGKLPDVPHHAVLFRPDAAGELYVANDTGVFMSVNSGVDWHNLSGNLPRAMVVDLVYQTATQTLLAATYGRSIWHTRLD